MRIKSVEPILLRIPFTDGGAGEGIMPDRWSHLDFTLVKITADNGLVGWGEGFGYYCSEATAAIIERSIKPLLIGEVLSSPESMCADIQRKMVLQGRYGISTFALSGVDIALWDLVAKDRELSLSELFGRRTREKVSTYASLVRYNDPKLISRYSEMAVSEGYQTVKLHEIEKDNIHPCRNTIGPDIDMVVDVNCNWSESFTREVIPELMELNTLWLEEPIFPPEDFALLADLRKTGMPIAAGENVCTAFQFAEMVNRGAVDYLQPSITKVGGVSEFRKIQKLERGRKNSLMPHSPYFGPGYLATLQMAAVDSDFGLFEYLYIEPEAWIYRDMPLPVRGEISIPDGPGMGMDPDNAVLEKYRI